MFYCLCSLRCFVVLICCQLIQLTFSSWSSATFVCQRLVFLGYDINRGLHIGDRRQRHMCIRVSSHTDKPLIYKIAGVWANHEGPLMLWAVSRSHLRAHATVLDLVCRLLLVKKKKTPIQISEPTRP